MRWKEQQELNVAGKQAIRYTFTWADPEPHPLPASTPPTIEGEAGKPLTVVWDGDGSETRRSRRTARPYRSAAGWRRSTWVRGC
jgi:hypothetical protein